MSTVVGAPVTPRSSATCHSWWLRLLRYGTASLLAAWMVLSASAGGSEERLPGRLRSRWRHSVGTIRTLWPMRHSADGWWVEEAGSSPPRIYHWRGLSTADRRDRRRRLHGLWAAWRALDLDPSCRIVVLERDRAGHGPSGRNGGFCKGLWLNLGDARPTPRRRRARWRSARAAEDAVAAIGDVVSRRGRRCLVSRGRLPQRRDQSAARRQSTRDAVTHARRLGVPDRAAALTAEETRARFGAPSARGGVLVPGATLQPARLARGLRDRLVTRGVRDVRAHAGRTRSVSTPTPSSSGPRGESVRAERAILAAGPALGSPAPAAAPPHRRVEPRVRHRTGPRRARGHTAGPAGRP